MAYAAAYGARISILVGVLQRCRAYGADNPHRILILLYALTLRVGVGEKQAEHDEPVQ